VFDGVDRCDSGFYCRNDRCDPVPEQGPASESRVTDQECAAGMRGLNAASETDQWKERWSALSASCRARLRRSCAPSIGQLRIERDPALRQQKLSALRPACRPLAVE